MVSIMCALQFLKYACGKIHTCITRVSKSNLRKLPVKKFNKGVIVSVLSYFLLYLFQIIIRLCV